MHALDENNDGVFNFFFVFGCGFVRVEGIKIFLCVKASGKDCVFARVQVHGAGHRFHKLHVQRYPVIKQ